MRIIAGRHRGRALVAPTGYEVRPTGGQAREALFNILAHAHWDGMAEDASVLEGAQVLDAFCGTGALGLEALSRGAAGCVFLDRNPQALEAARQNIEKLGESGRCQVMRGDALRPPPARSAATLAFLDPPYREAVLESALVALAGRGWFAPGAVVVAETDRRNDFTPPPGFLELDRREYRNTRLAILRFRTPP
jgi:16S rRNA (guanine966-N2)-methyltransferase